LSDIPGNDNTSGFLVPQRDADALTERLEYLITNPQTWQHLGKNGREHVQQHYDIELLNQKLARIYHDLINQ